MFDRTHGSKPGSAGQKSTAQVNLDRRDRLRALALETVDLANDPYFMKNHLGKYECKLCLTLHSNEGSYLAHTQGKRHQQNLGRRASKLAEQRGEAPVVERKKIQPRKTVKIGRPGYKVVKQRDHESNQKSLLFQIQYPQIEETLRPRYRFMSAYEQRVEPPDDKFQFILFAAEPYETIGFKIPKIEIDRERFFTHWDPEKFVFTLQLFFVAEGAPARGGGNSSNASGGDSFDEDNF